jgi:hypothetical protein
MLHPTTHCSHLALICVSTRGDVFPIPCVSLGHIFYIFTWNEFFRSANASTQQGGKKEKKRKSLLTRECKNVGQVLFPPLLIHERSIENSLTRVAMDPAPDIFRINLWFHFLLFFFVCVERHGCKNDANRPCSTKRGRN